METETKKFTMIGTGRSYVLTLLLLAAFFSSVTLGQHYAYVVNQGDLDDPNNDDLSIMDLATNEVVATVPVGDVPQGITVNPAGTAVYVANTLSNSFTVIDTTTFESTTIPGPGGVGATGAALHPNGQRIYIANPDWFTQGENSTVWVVDRATNAVIDEISCGKGSCGISVHPAGTVAYVTNAFDGTMAVFDTSSHEMVHTIVLETIDPNEVNMPVPIAVHPDGTYVYAANRVGPSVWAVNTATYEVTTVASGAGHVGLGINPAGTVLYVPDFADFDPSAPEGKTVDVLDAKTLQRITTIDGLNAPLEVSVHPDGTRIYVTNWGNNTVSVLDAATYGVLATIPGGNHPGGFGEFVGPGVPRLLLEDAVARLQAAQTALAESAEGVNSPQKAIEYLATALTSGNACLQESLWSMAGGKVDPRRLQRAPGATVFVCSQTMVEAVLDAIRRGWIVNARLEAELLAVVNEVVRADRVLAAVGIDDAIMAQVEAADLDLVQQTLEQGDARAKEAALWPQLDKKASLFHEAVSGYQSAWEMARNLMP